MNPATKKIFPLLVLSAFLSTSCAEFYGDVSVNNDPKSTSSTPATPWEGNHATWNFLWGPVPVEVSGKMETQPGCLIHDIKVTQDFFQAACSFFTLGGIKPANLDWKIGPDDPKDPKKNESSQTTCCWAWGLVPGDAPAIFDAKACGIHDVKATQDFLQGFCTFITLGAIKPMSVQYKLGGHLRPPGPPI